MSPRTSPETVRSRGELCPQAPKLLERVDRSRSHCHDSFARQRRCCTLGMPFVAMERPREVRRRDKRQRISAQTCRANLNPFRSGARKALPVRETAWGHSREGKGKASDRGHSANRRSDRSTRYTGRTARGDGAYGGSSRPCNSNVDWGHTWARRRTRHQDKLS